LTTTVRVLDPERPPSTVTMSVTVNCLDGSGPGSGYVYVVWFGVLEVPDEFPKFQDQTGWQFGGIVDPLALKVNRVPGWPAFL
jgi:hypothetical protein